MIYSIRFLSGQMLLVSIVALTMLACKKKEETPQVCNLDQYEPNNSFETSFELTDLSENDSLMIWAGISSSSDIDYFRITLREGTHWGMPGTAQLFEMSAKLLNPSGSDFDLFVYNESGVLLGSSEIRGAQMESVQYSWQGAHGVNDSRNTALY
jgi:hypothetical protein